MVNESRRRQMSAAGRHLISLFGFCSLLAAAGCSGPVDLAAETEALLATDKAASAASVERGAAHAFYLHAEEGALLLPDGGLPVLGRESIRVAMSSLDDYELSWQPQEAVVSKSGDLGYTWGYYTLTSKGDQSTITPAQGKYLTVWKKQENGKWKVVVDMNNGDAEP